MVGACQQNSGIFLVRGGGAGRDAGGLGIGWQPDVTAADRCWAGSGTSRDRVGGSQITGAGGGKINSKESAL